MSTKLWTEEQFNCPVCLDLPNDPVTIPCGHSYCMACIKDYWSKDDPKGIYSCPQCRQTFCPKPSLSRNTMLAEAVEQLRKTAQKGGTGKSVRGPRGSGAKLTSSAVQCDMCKTESRAAVKSCLVCMSSYCQAHLKPHQTKKSLKQHELIAPTSNLAEKICTQHKYLQEFYCRQCRGFICWLCTSDLHKGHDAVSTKTERLEKQKMMSELLTGNQQKLKEREQELKDMKKMMDGMKRSADRVHTEKEKVLVELQRSVERLEELLEEMLEQANQDKMNQAEEVHDSLEAEIKELKKRGEEMKDLSSCEDHIHYLETYESMCSPLESGDLPVVNVNPDASFEPVMDAILDLRERVEDMCNQELGKITKQVNDVVLFTLGDASKNGPKGGILKLFSGLGSRSANSRSPSSTPTLSGGTRGADRRGGGYKSQDVRSRDTRGNTNSPRLRQRRDEREREAVREQNLRPGPSTRSSSSSQPSTNSSLQPSPSTRSSSSHQPSPRSSSSLQPSPSTRSGSSPRPSPTPSRRESHSLWNRSSQMQPAPAPAPTPVPHAAPAPAPSPTPSRGFSRMASISSISSIFRSHRRGTTPATPVSSNAHVGDAQMAGTNPWGVATLPETPTEINPGLFLDSPSPTNDMPAFPALREINLDSIQAPEPRSREDFLQYSVSLTLDPNTAHRRLVLSEDNTKATLQGAANTYPDTAQRFDGWTQVMCQSPLCSQSCYWEVEWRGRGSSMGVAYGALARKGADARAALGYNAQSWTVELSDTCCSALHDNEKKDIAVTYSPRVGIFLDMSAGTLAFYSVAGTMTHLHTFRANFTQPLYAVFGVGSGVGVGLDFALGQFNSTSDSIKICPM